MVKMTGVWDRTSDFLRDDAARWFPVAVGLIFLPNLLSGIADGAVAGQPTAMSAATGIAAIAFALLTLWGGAAISALAMRVSRPGEAVAHAGRRLPVIVGLTLLLLAIAVALVVPLALILAAGGVDMTRLAATESTMPEMSGGTAMLLLAYGLTLSIVSLWVSARLLVLVPVILAERLGVKSIGRAWRLTRGHGLRLVGVLLLYGLVAGISTMAVSAVAGLAGALVSGDTPGIGIGTVLVAAAVAVVATLLTLVQGAFVGKLYAALTSVDGVGPGEIIA
ncbi:hypothetical protein [Sphingomonas sp.]|uniref:hypothetical protein n=1 Tax=Sphingomonas sp. TaxID=28214 RepID=UPI002BBC4D4D|nr:hypothetical protein [Sphingomonas sp.]HTG37367.1 hypothetical protein [Sphingomonas sp.]